MRQVEPLKLLFFGGLVWDFGLFVGAYTARHDLDLVLQLRQGYVFHLLRPRHWFSQHLMDQYLGQLRVVLGVLQDIMLRSDSWRMCVDAFHKLIELGLRLGHGHQFRVVPLPHEIHRRLLRTIWKKLLTEPPQRIVHVDRPHPFERGLQECVTVVSPWEVSIRAHGIPGACGKPLGEVSVDVARLVLLAHHVSPVFLHLRTKVCKLQSAPLATSPSETVTVYHPDDGGVGEALYPPRKYVLSKVLLLNADEGHHGVVNT